MTKRKPKPVVIKSPHRIRAYRYERMMRERCVSGCRAMMSYECVKATPAQIFDEVYSRRDMIPCAWWGDIIEYAYTRTGRGNTTIAEAVRVFIRNSR